MTPDSENLPRLGTPEEQARWSAESDAMWAKLPTPAPKQTEFEYPLDIWTADFLESLRPLLSFLEESPPEQLGLVPYFQQKYPNSNEAQDKQNAILRAVSYYKEIFDELDRAGLADHTDYSVDTLNIFVIHELHTWMVDLPAGHPKPTALQFVSRVQARHPAT